MRPRVLSIGLLGTLAITGCFSPDMADDADATGGGGSSSNGEPSTGGPGEADGDTAGMSSATLDGSGDGSSGTDGAPCTTDADCDDRLACNGAETCTNGACAPGDDPCANPNANHCVVVCTEGDDGPQCAVQAADADGDRHGDIACAEAPGDDCDDTRDTVYAGAEEICDGLDNDCNALVDVDDGLPLYGTPTIVNDVYFADLAYSPVDSVYGIAYNGPVGDFYVSYNADQSVRATPRAFPPTANSAVKLEWGGVDFAGVYVDSSFMRMSRVDVDGTIEDTQLIANPGNAIDEFGVNTRDGDGWSVVWGTNTDDRRAALLDSAGVAAGNVVTVGAPVVQRDSRLAENSDTFAWMWSEPGTGLHLEFRDDQFSVADTTVLTANPLSIVYGAGDVKTIGTGYAVAYSETGALQRVRYAEYETDGSLRCGPITLSDTSQPFIQAMDAHDTTAVIYLDEGASHRLHRVGEGCVLIGEPIEIENVPFYSEISDIDINASGIGIVTQIFDDGGANPRMSFRAFGPNLCDAPI